MIQFYCYSRCSTCKKAKKYLDNNGLDYEYIEITEHNLTKDDIEVLHERSQKNLKKLFNTSGNVYRELNLKDKLSTLEPSEAYELLASEGMLMKRPILISDHHVLFGFKEDEYEEVVNDVNGSN